MQRFIMFDMLNPFMLKKRPQLFMLLFL